jgi:transposase
LIAPPPNVRVWLACGLTDMRKGFDGLASLAQNHLGKDPFSGQLFVFRGRRGDLIKVLCWDGQACVCSRSGLKKAASCGPRRKTARSV